MPAVTDAHADQLAEVCRRFGVRRLELFGSAATSAFDPKRSDIDLLVDFDPPPDQDLFRQYFGLKEALEQLLGRAVDLVMLGAMKNRHFIESVSKTRRLIYASPDAKAA